MPDTKKTAAPVEAPAEPASGLREVRLEFNGNTYSVQAKSKAEGERIIHAHIDAITNPVTPAE